MKKKLLTALILMATIGRMQAQTSWTYGFGTSTGTFPLTAGGSLRSDQAATTPELLDPTAPQVARLRLSSSTGNPGNFDLVNTGFSAATGSSLKIRTTDNNAINKFSVYSIPGTNVFSVQFNIRFGAGAAGTYLFSVGNDGGSATGTDYYSNSANLTTDGSAKSFATLRWVLGASTHTFAARAGNAYTTVSTSVNPSISFSPNSEHTIELYCNNESTASTYTRGAATYNLAANSWQIWLNNTQLFISSGVANFTAGDISSSTALNAFLFNAYSSSDNAEVFLDNFLYANYLANLTTLPVSLTSFIAKKQAASVQLQWTTMSERNNAYFDIERSTDGKLFVPIGRKEGSGNSSTGINYSFTDPNPEPGLSYYQLKQVDLDGKTTIFNPVAVDMGAEELAMDVFSPPNGTDLRINIRSGKGDKGQLSVYTISGERLAEQSLSLSKGNNEFSISIPHLGNGLYLATYQSGTQGLTQKFIR